VLYLTDKFQRRAGRPVGHPQRGAYVSWLAYYSGVIEPVLNFQFAGLGDNPVLQRTFRDVPAMHERISGALAAGPWILGKEFSGVDILVASMGQFVRTMLPAGEVVDAYLARCNARPGPPARWPKIAAGHAQRASS
jgi:glutathione S-transferase